MYKNKLNNFAFEKLNEDYIEMTNQEIEHFNKYGSDGFNGGNMRSISDIEFEKEKLKRQELDNLSLTAADVERAIYKAKNMDFEDIIELVKNNSEIDIKALKIELKANNFYRGNPYINKIGTLLGYSEQELDYLFENKELPAKAESAEDISKTETTTNETSVTENDINNNSENTDKNEDLNND